MPLPSFHLPAAHAPAAPQSERQRRVVALGFTEHAFALIDLAQLRTVKRLVRCLAAAGEVPNRIRLHLPAQIDGVIDIMRERTRHQETMRRLDTARHIVVGTVEIVRFGRPELLQQESTGDEGVDPAVGHISLFQGLDDVLDRHAVFLFVRSLACRLFSSP